MRSQVIFAHLYLQARRRHLEVHRLVALRICVLFLAAEARQSEQSMLQSLTWNIHLALLRAIQMMQRLFAGARRVQYLATKA
jgi:hypothetical protein